jgi:hypothetical protein
MPFHTRSTQRINRFLESDEQACARKLAFSYKSSAGGRSRLTKSPRFDVIVSLHVGGTYCSEPQRNVAFIENRLGDCAPERYRVARPDGLARMHNTAVNQLSHRRVSLDMIGVMSN